MEKELLMSVVDRLDIIIQKDPRLHDGTRKSAEYRIGYMKSTLEALAETIPEVKDYLERRVNFLEDLFKNVS
jgi:hypothetical protein